MYPSNQKYKISVENGFYFINGEFQQNFYHAVKSPDGSLLFQTGQNATVFKVRDRNENTKALKLFFKEDDQRGHRYKVIGEYLNRLNSDYFINFEYKERLIYVDDVNPDDQDSYFPALVMDWVEGSTLEKVVKILTSNNDRKRLKTLATKFLELSKFLIANDFSHGDLKHDNIIVDSDFKLKLIDYDGIFVPALKGEHSFELGTKSFQHPKRTKDDFNERIDDFSILSIYVSLLTFSKFPSYYKRFSDQQNLFFREEDFLDPEHSEIFNLLKLDNELKPLVTSILTSLKRDNIYIKELADLLDGIFPIPKLTKEIATSFNFYQDENKQIILDTKDCNDALILLNGISSDNFNFDTVLSRLSIQIEDEKASELTIILKNDYGENVIQSKINIKPKCEVIYFKSETESYKEGSEAVLTYKLKNYKYAEIRNDRDNSFSSVLTSEDGKISFIINRAATYYLKIIDQLDNVIFTHHTLLEIVYPVEIQFFKSNYQSIFEGIPIDLSWEVTNADKIILCTDRFEKEDVSGLDRISLTPLRNVGYTLECSNKYYETKSPQRVNISVQPNPHLLSLNNLTPNLKDLSIDYELNKIELDALDLNLPKLDLSVNLNINLDQDGAIKIQSINKKSIKDQLINLLKFKK